MRRRCSLGLPSKSSNSKRAIKKFRCRKRRRSDSPDTYSTYASLFALTGASHSLDSAAPHPVSTVKQPFPGLGVITEQAIDYGREDVAATTRLDEAVTTEYATHPINLTATTAYSSVFGFGTRVPRRAR